MFEIVGVRLIGIRNLLNDPLLALNVCRYVSLSFLSYDLRSVKYR